MDSAVDTQAVQNFLRLARGAQTKDDFISRVRQFDQKFIDGYPAPAMAPLPNIPRSNSQTGSNFKSPQQPEPHKNPFVNSAEQKFKAQKQNTMPNQFQYQQPQQVQPQMNRNRGPPLNLPHTRSQTNFYRQEEQFYEEFNFNPNQIIYGQDFHQGDQIYNPGMMNRSYSGQQAKQRTPYGTSQPYIQNNQFVASYETEEPEYVKYYKKMIPQPKPNLAPTPRSNPFKAV